jgi:hypothetical protein
METERPRQIVGRAITALLLYGQTKLVKDFGFVREQLFELLGELREATTVDVIRRISGRARMLFTFDKIALHLPDESGATWAGGHRTNLYCVAIDITDWETHPWDQR